MITCPKCGKQLADGTKFCGTCGTPVSGIQTSGNPVSGGTAGGMQAGVRPVQKTEKKMSKEVYLFAGIGAAAVCVLILVLAFVFFLRGRGTGAADYVFYVKDGQLFFADLSDPEPWQITSRFAEGGADNEDLAYRWYGDMCRVSGDGKTVFYPDRISLDNWNFSLYYRSASRQKEEPVRIDTDVDSYVVNDDGTLVTYIKKDVFYQYDLKKDEKVKICDLSGSDYWDSLDEIVSEDGRVWYKDAEDIVYCWYQGEKERVDSGSIELCYVSEEKDWILYRKEGALYRKQYGEDKKRIASEYSGYMAYDTGEVYFEKEEGILTLMDFVQDDMDSADESANAMRQQLSEWEVASLFSLYYFDGEEEKKVTDASIMRGHMVSDVYPAIAFSRYDSSDIRKIRLSELQSISDFYDEVTETLFDPDHAVLCIALKDQVTEMESGFHISRFLFDTEGKMACFVDDAEDTGYGDLYRVELSGNKAGKAEICDQDVGTYYFYINEQGQMVYFKDYDFGKDQGDLYIDGKLVDYEVRDSVRYEPDLEKSFYYVDNMLKAYAGDEPEEIGEVAEDYRYYDTFEGGVICFYDYSSEYGRGDLGLYQKGELKKIGEDVYSYNVVNDAVLYLRDYSRNYYRGDLYLYRDGESEKLDEDVVTMIFYSVQ